MSDKSSGPAAQENSNVAPLRRARPCPNCGATSARDTFPFCSKRCADLDLNRWLNGSYAIPVVEDDHGINDDE